MNTFRKYTLQIKYVQLSRIATSVTNLYGTKVTFLRSISEKLYFGGSTYILKSISMEVSFP